MARDIESHQSINSTYASECYWALMKAGSESSVILRRTKTNLLQVLHHEGEFLHVSLVALLPGLLLLATSIPAQTLDDVMRHR